MSFWDLLSGHTAGIDSFGEMATVEGRRGLFDLLCAALGHSGLGELV
jgi:hypothetical protein